ncbi:uncharacterized protein LOC115887682 isoform X2 [Sitophilus oryzae]|uniref:Uncharacterized protein LOC115887682 isoform X2 n=1 Tax=Sitophilus oryzae TaxID=7048 RepID=A0A6J2YIA9_SITOR|nr:uncharacterized protein LOC115887682 isoform X2 [Sitophilus oryzae]
MHFIEITLAMMVTKVQVCCINLLLIQPLRSEYTYGFIKVPHLQNDHDNDNFIENEMVYSPNSADGGDRDINSNYDFSITDEDILDDDSVNKVSRQISSNFENVIDPSFFRKKKNQILCRVQKTFHHHNEAGYEFFPKSYTSYTCQPATTTNIDPTAIASHDVCFVRSNVCTTLQMKRFFLRRNTTNTCWSDLVSMEVNSGCNCLYQYKYRIHI